MRLPGFHADAVGHDWPYTRLHVILLTTFAALLALLLGAGLSALHFLRQLESAERGLAQSLSARTESLTDLIYSVHLYNDRIQKCLLEDKSKREEFTELSRRIQVRLHSYPPGRSPEEQQMLASIYQQTREQEQIVVQILSWNVSDRHRRALAYLRDVVLPRQLQILNTREKIALWNQQQLEETGKRQLEYFDGVRRNLTQVLLLALAAGVGLASMSLAYMLRLARQARGSYRQMRQLSARLLDAQEEERRSISRELHDEVGQSLGSLLVDAGRLGAMLPAGDTAAHERLRKIKDTAENTLQSVRDMALLLRPSMLDDLGLVAALEWQGREISRRSDAEVQVDAEGIPDDLPDEYKTTIYRLVQEALHNASRHAHAHNIRVAARQTGDRIAVEVADDGSGFDPQRTRGMGILGMEERVNRLDGTMSIDSRPGAGTTLRFELPWRRQPS
jgi:signal transduction histidine kinase